MKRLCMLISILMLLTGCRSAQKQSVSYALADTVFTYNGTSYNLTERRGEVNSITEVIPVGPGEHYVIVGHTGPKNHVYFVFNAENEMIESEIDGVCLTWRDNDITTAMYAFWSGIYDYTGNEIAKVEMDEGEYISELEFDDDGESLLVTIESGEGQRAEKIKF